VFALVAHTLAARRADAASDEGAMADAPATPAQETA
jgi:hypothetical protein